MTEQGNVRVVGSGFTTFNYKGVPLAWLEGINDSGQQPYAGNEAPVQAIYPIGAKRAIEIVTTRVLAMGTLRLSLRELWNAPVWQQLGGLEGTWDIVQVYERLAQDSSFVTCQTIITPPNGLPPRGKTYHNCIITAIDDGEQVQAGSMAVARNITLAYTHTTPING